MIERSHTAPWTFESHPDEHDQEPLETTPLDPIESSGLDDWSPGGIFRHSGWAKQRKKVHDALQATFQKKHRINAFEACGHNCFVLRSTSDPTEVKIAASCCHDRFCLPCAQGRSRVIALNIAEHLQRSQARFVTLTLRHRSDPLATSLDRLYTCFKLLRKTKLWKNTQRGGAAFLEIKRSRDRKSWHPHFHVLTTGKFIDVAKLATLWKAITTDSFIVDVRAVPNIETAVNYVTKYASKPFDATLYEDTPTLQEAIVALAGRRMVVTFGNFKGLQMTEKPSEDAWEFLGSLRDLALRAAEGDTAAERIVRRACGERSEDVLRWAAAQVVPRMNPTRPPTPNVKEYLESNAEWS